MSREDPKPGRWILPLVVAGLVGFTYVFVNALPQAEVPTPSASTTTVASTTTAGPSTTTGPTLNPDAAAFVESTDTIERNVADLAGLAQQINDAWDARDVEFRPTREALEDLETQTNTLADDVAAIEVPNPATDDWEAVTQGLNAMRRSSAGMIDGLVNSEGPDRRLTALENYKNATDAIAEALAKAREAVRDPAA